MSGLHALLIAAAITFGSGATVVCAQMAGGSTVTTAPSASVTRATCATCGVVESIRFVQKPGDASGLGAVAGGVLGGVVGHQFGSARGNTAMTIAGAAGGAYAGHQVEKSRNAKSYYNVTVRLDSGRTKTLSQGSRPAVKEGDRVKIVDGKRLALLAK